MLSDKLEPLVEGVRNNRVKWMEIAAANSLVNSTPETKDSNDNVSKPSSPSDSKNGNAALPETNCIRSCSPISD